MDKDNIPDLTINNLNVPSIRGFSNAQNQIEPIIFNDTLKIYSLNDKPDLNNELHSNNLAIYDNAKESFVNIFSDNGTLKYNDYSLLDSNNLISELNNNIDDFELTVNTDTNSLDYLNISNLKILGNDFDDSSSTTYKVYVTINDANKGGGVDASSIIIGNTSTIGVNPLTKALSQNDIITFFNGAKFTLTQNSGLNATEITGQLTINTIATGQIGAINKTEEISANIPYLNFTSEGGENGHGLRYNPTTGQVQYKNLGVAGWTNISAAFLDIKLSCVLATTSDLSVLLGNNVDVIYDNGTDGVGATLTRTSNGVFPDIDGETLTQNQRILVKDQNNKRENGIYQLSTVGDETTPWVLTRTTDADTPAKLNAGAFTVIEFGSQKGNSYTFLTENTNTDTVVIGTTQFIISIIGSASAITGINNPGPNKLLAFNNTSNTILDGQDNLTFDGTNLVIVGNTKTNTIKSQVAGTGLDIQFDGETTNNKISLTDNLSDALNITENTNSYMKFITTDGSEQIVFGKNTTFSGTTIADLGTVTTANIIGGTIDANIVGGTIDATTIGATTPSSGVFTELTISTNFLVNREEANITSSGAQTYLIANLKKGLIRRDCGGSNVSDIIDTAANIVAGLTNAQVGTSFEFVVENNSDSDETITITGSSGITLYGNMTIKQNKAKSFLAVITNIGGGTEAVSIYQLGGGGGDLNDLGDVELNTNKNGTYGLPIYGPDHDDIANQALTFDGIDDYVNIPYSFSSIKSISMRIKITNLSGNPIIIYLKSDTYIEINNGSISTPGFTTPTVYVNKAPPITLIENTWYHIVVTTSTLITTDNNVLIGKKDSTFFEGSISDVRLYNNELTQTNVNDIYDNNLIGSEQAHYKFDQATDSDNIAVEQGDFFYHANIITSPGYTTDKDDGENQALSFNGINNYVNIPHIVSGIKSISLRIYPEVVTQQTLVYLNSNTYIEINSSAQINARGFAATPNIYLNNVAETVTNSGNDNNGSSTLSINTWYHIVVTTETAIATDNPFYFAKGATTYYFEGKISDVKFHNSVLNGDDITLLFNDDSEIIGNEIVHYRMNEENGSNVNDSVNSNLYIANTPLNAIVGKAVFNSSIGIQALNNIQIGEENLAIGYQALKSLVTGNNNIALGTFAGKNIIRSNYNIFIGSYSGQNTKGFGNTFIGFESGARNQTGNNNTVLGNSANVNDDDAQNQIVIGYGAISKGDNTVVLGNDNITDVFCARNASATLHSTAIMLTETTSVAPDTGFGRLWVKPGATTSDPNELHFTTDDGDDIQITSGTSLNATVTLDGLTDVKFTSSANLFIGNNSPGNSPQHGTLTLTAVNNLGILTNSLKALTDGAANIAIGDGTLELLTNGNDNICIGSSSGSVIVSSSQNVAIGSSSLNSNTGNNNTAIGFSSGLNNTSGANNVFIGSQSGDLNQTGINNICIGDLTDVSSNSAENQIVIGQGATGIQNNSVTLGNEDVTDIYCSQDKGATLHSTAIMLTETTRANTVNGFGRLWVNSANTPNELYFTNENNQDIQITSGTSLNASSAISSVTNGLDNRVATFSGANSLNGESNLIFNGTNLGVGTSDPAKALHVVNSALVKGRASFGLTGSIDVTGANTDVPGSGTKFETELSIGDDIEVGGETRTIATITNNTTATVTTAWSSDLSNDTSPQCNPAAFTVIRDTGDIGMLLDDDGNVGIGVLSPSQQLEVSNKIKSKGFISNIPTATDITSTSNQTINFLTSVNFNFNITDAGPYIVNLTIDDNHLNGNLTGQSGQIYISNNSSSPSTITWATSDGWHFESDSGGNIIVPNITGVAGSIDVFNYIILSDTGTASGSKILVTKANHFQHYT